MYSVDVQFIAREVTLVFAPIIKFFGNGDQEFQFQDAILLETLYILEDHFWRIQFVQLTLPKSNSTVQQSVIPNSEYGIRYRMAI